MTQSCKRDTKSKSHPGMKFALVRVFPCKHTLKLEIIYRKKYIYKLNSKSSIGSFHKRCKVIYQLKAI